MTCVSSGQGVAMVRLGSGLCFSLRLVGGQSSCGLADSRYLLVGGHHVDGSFVLRYTDVMARPRGRTKPARLTVNLDRPTYLSLVELAKREDVSVSWVVRRAIEVLLASDREAPVAPALGSRDGGGNRAGSGEMAP